MKKLILLMAIFLISVMAFSDNLKYRTAYILIPEEVKVSDTSQFKVTGIIRDANKNSEKKIVEGDNLSVDELKDLDIFESLKVIKVRIGHENENDRIKFALGYKVPSQDKYSFISSHKPTDDVMNNIEKDYTEGVQPFDLFDSSRFSFVDLPGFELEKDTRLFGIAIGDKAIDDSERTEPSNISAKIGQEYEISGEIEINPNSTPKEFKIKYKSASKEAIDELTMEEDFKNFKEKGRHFNSDDVDGEKVDVTKVMIKPLHKGEIDGFQFNTNTTYTLTPKDGANVVVEKKKKGEGHWYLSGSFSISSGGVAMLVDDGARFEMEVIEMNTSIERTGRKRVSGINMMLQNDTEIIYPAIRIDYSSE